MFILVFFGYLFDSRILPPPGYLFLLYTWKRFFHGKSGEMLSCISGKAHNVRILHSCGQEHLAVLSVLKDFYCYEEITYYQCQPMTYLYAMSNDRTCIYLCAFYLICTFSTKNSNSIIMYPRIHQSKLHASRVILLHPTRLACDLQDSGAPWLPI